MGNACVSHTSPAKTAASRSAPVTAKVTAGVWTAAASVTKAFMGRTARQVGDCSTVLYVFIVFIRF